MARTQLPRLTQERLINRFAVWMMGQQTDRLDTARWTLEAVGYDPALIDTLIDAGRREAGMPTPAPPPAPATPDPAPKHDAEIRPVPKKAAG